MNATKNGEWLELEIRKEWASYTTEKLLKEQWQVPKKLLHQWRMEKAVQVNGEPYPWTKPLPEGEAFKVKLFKEEAYDVIPTPLQISVLYEDDHLLIVNKPAQMDTHPTDEKQSKTLSNAVAYHFKMTGVQTKIRHIHRLDKDTTGAILFAKHALAGATLDRMLEERIIKRTYLALVHGKVSSRKGTINKAIGKDRHHPTRRRVSPTGQKAITHYEVMDYDLNNDTTLVKLQLDTGRTHQIRVHMSYLGHPLLGDTQYGGRKNAAPRQALHAAKIEFPHPITGETVSCTAPFIDERPLFHFELNKL